MSIRKKAGLLFVGRVVYSLSQLVLVILLARMASIKELDSYMLAIAIAGPIVMFSQMSMRTYLITDYDNEFNISDYIKSRKYLSIISFISILIFGYFSIEEVNSLYILFFVALFKTIESLIDIYCGLFQRESSVKLVAYSNISRGLTSVLSMLIMLWVFDSVVVGLIFTSIAWLFILYMQKDYTDKYIGMDVVKYNYSVFMKLLKKCLPLGFMMMLVSLNFNVPVYLINMLNTGENVGVYSSIAYLLLIGKVVSESFVQASAPKVSEYISKKEYMKLKQLSRKLLALGVGLGLFGLLFAILFGELFLSILYGEIFSVYSDVFIIIMLAALFSYISQSYGMVLTAWRNLRHLLLIHSIQTITVLVTGVICIPNMGIRGAALSLVSGYFVIMLLNVALYNVNMLKYKRSISLDDSCKG